MTSIYGADPVYYPLGPSIVTTYQYRARSVMEYIYQHCSVFALCFQKSNHDLWADSPDFQSTCFIPSELYSQKSLPHFKSVDYTTARDLVLTSTIHGCVDKTHLIPQELLPTYKHTYIKVHTNAYGVVFVNGLSIRESIQCDNGIIHVIDGFLSLVENYIR